MTTAADLRPLLLSPEEAAALDAPGTKDAAVLVPLYFDRGARHAVFTKRRDDLKQAGDLPDETVLRYLNRASDAVYAIARYADTDQPELFEGRT